MKPMENARKIKEHGNLLKTYGKHLFLFENYEDKKTNISYAWEFIEHLKNTYVFYLNHWKTH